MRVADVLIAILLIASLPAEASAKWTKLRSQNFLVVGEASEGRIRRTAQKLEQFRDMLAQVLPGAVTISPTPTVVVVFPTGWAFTPYAPAGRAGDLVGYSASWEDVNYIAMNAGRADLADSIVFHEYTHLLVGNTLGEVPLWVNEGLAELYATFQEESGGRGAMIGAGRGYHLGLLRSRSLMPIADLVAIDDGSPEHNEIARRGMLYAQSWALMHYLSFGPANRQSQLGAYLTALQSGQPAGVAFAQAFGTDLAPLDRELAEYVRRFSMPAVRVEFSRTIAIDTSLRGEAMDDLEGQSYLADLLVRIGRTDEARLQAKRVIDRDPARARAIAAIGLIELEAQRVEEAVPLLERAAALAPEDPAILGTLGRAWLARANRSSPGSEASNASLAHARQTLERAAVLAPEAAHVLAMLGYVALLDGIDPERAVLHLSTAVRMAPAREQYQLRLAEALLRTRQFDRAVTYLTPLATRGRSQQVRDGARKLLTTVVRQQLGAVPAAP